MRHARRETSGGARHIFTGSAPRLLLGDEFPGDACERLHVVRHVLRALLRLRGDAIANLAGGSEPERGVVLQRRAALRFGIWAAEPDHFLELNDHESKMAPAQNRDAGVTPSPYVKAPVSRRLQAYK